MKATELLLGSHYTIDGAGRWLPLGAWQDGDHITCQFRRCTGLADVDGRDVPQFEFLEMPETELSSRAVRIEEPSFFDAVRRAEDRLSKGEGL